MREALVGRGATVLPASETTAAALFVLGDGIDATLDDDKLERLRAALEVEVLVAVDAKHVEPRTLAFSLRVRSRDKLVRRFLTATAESATVELKRATTDALAASSPPVGESAGTISKPAADSAPAAGHAAAPAVPPPVAPSPEAENGTREKSPAPLKAGSPPSSAASTAATRSSATVLTASPSPETKPKGLAGPRGTIYGQYGMGNLGLGAGARGSYTEGYAGFTIAIGIDFFYHSWTENTVPIRAQAIAIPATVGFTLAGEGLSLVPRFGALAYAQSVSVASRAEKDEQGIMLDAGASVVFGGTRGLMLGFDEYFATSKVSVFSVGAVL